MGEHGIPIRETLDIEFKNGLKRIPVAELIDAIVTRRNIDGEELCVGVEDDKTPTGVNKTHSSATQPSALIADKTVPTAARSYYVVVE